LKNTQEELAMTTQKTLSQMHFDPNFVILLLTGDTERRDCPLNAMKNRKGNTLEIADFRGIGLAILCEVTIAEENRPALIDALLACMEESWDYNADLLAKALVKLNAVEQAWEVMRKDTSFRKEDGYSDTINALCNLGVPVPEEFQDW
jgi:hypothetical protein